MPPGTFALPGGQDLLIIAITANAFAEDRALQASRDGLFSTKPINPDVFIPLLLTSLMAHRQKMSDNQSRAKGYGWLKRGFSAPLVPIHTPGLG